jgi:hypothetical protein
MPKISVSQGPTYGDPDPEREIGQEDSEDTSSLGTNSEESSETSEKTPDALSEKRSTRTPARSTGNRSK